MESEAGKSARFTIRLPFTMITAFATTETAVQAMKFGAYDYMIKPFRIDEFKLLSQKALEKRRLRKPLQLQED